MDAIKFFKIDFKITKAQMKIIVLFIILSVGLGIYMNSPTFAFSYICFGFMVISTTPFAMDQSEQSGFYALLPATAFSRVVGRYCYYFGMIAAAAGVGLLTMLICQAVHHSSPENNGIFIIINMSFVLIIGCIQYLLHYIFGHVKGQTVIMLLRLVPVFVFFFGIQWIGDIVEPENIASAPGMVQSLMENINVLILPMMLLTGVIAIICIIISARICEHRDM